MANRDFLHPQIRRTYPLAQESKVRREVLYEALTRSSKRRIGGRFFDLPGDEGLNAACQRFAVAVGDDYGQSFRQLLPDSGKRCHTLHAGRAEHLIAEFSQYVFGRAGRNLRDCVNHTFDPLLIPHLLHARVSSLQPGNSPEDIRLVLRQPQNCPACPVDDDSSGHCGAESQENGAGSGCVGAARGLKD